MTISPIRQPQRELILPHALAQGGIVCTIRLPLCVAEVVRITVRRP